jgi:hypothetical protein
MARQEHPREDLLAEATALRPRVALRVIESDVLIVVGFRAGDSASFFFDQDPAYHFTPSGELRRAFVAGELYKADRGKLARLVRRRGTGRVQFTSTVLDEEAETELLTGVSSRLEHLAVRLGDGRYDIIGQVPRESDPPALERVAAWLDRFARHRLVANDPKRAITPYRRTAGRRRD